MRVSLKPIFEVGYRLYNHFYKFIHILKHSNKMKWLHPKHDATKKGKECGLPLCSRYNH
jgi:hypothetical protein